MLGDRKRAADLIRQAVEAGVSPGRVGSDRTLKSLRGVPAFEAIAPDVRRDRVGVLADRM